MSEIPDELGEEQGDAEEPWIGQAPLDIYLDELGIAHDSPDVERLVQQHYETLEKLGEVGQLFLKKVAYEYHYKVGPFTIEQWWQRVEGERRYRILEAKSQRNRQAARKEFASSATQVERPFDAKSACEDILDAWEVHPPPLWQALKKVRSMSGEPNTPEFRCLVRLVAWISSNFLNSPADLREVADEVVRAYLAGASSLTNVKDICKRGKTHASAAFGEHFGSIVGDVIEKNIILLLDSREGKGVAKLSSNFRKYGRPDLSLEATEGYRPSQDGGIAVCTSRAAAYADLERLDEALELCRSVWDTKQSDAVCTVKSRTLRLMRNNQESHRWALEGWGLSENRFTARTLAASSALMGDMLHLQAAAAYLDWFDEGTAQSNENDPFILVKAGWVLLNDGEIDQAREVALRVQREYGGYREAGALLNAANHRDRIRRPPT